MADDISNYALNLAFALQAGPAMTSLSGVQTAIDNIKQGLIDASGALSGITTVSSALQEQFVKTATSSTEISNTTAKIETTLTDIHKHHSEMGILAEKAAKIENKSFLNFDKLRKWYTTYFKERKLDFVQIKAQAKLEEQITASVKAGAAAGTESAKQTKAQSGFTTMVAAGWASVKGSMGGAAEEGKKHIGIGNTVAAAWTGVAKGVWGTVVAFADMLVGIQAIKIAFAAFIDEENKFNTANYRIYGSQTDIIRKVNETQRAFGLMRKQVLEAYVSIGASIRTSDDDLSAMVNTNVQFSMILGVNQKDLGAWQRSMTGIGIGIKESRALLSHYVSVMREMGMTAQQMSKILGDQAASATQMNFIYGKEGVKHLNAYTTAIGGLGNAANIAEADVSDAVSGLNKSFTTNTLLLQGMNTLTQEQLDTIPPGLQAAAKAQSGFESVMARVDDAVAGINQDTKEGAASAEVAIGALGNVGGLTAKQLMTLNQIQQKTAGGSLEMWRKNGDALREMVQATKDFAREEAAAKGVDALTKYDMEQASASLAVQFEEAFSYMRSSLSDFMVAFKPVAIFLLYAIGAIIDVLRALMWVITGVVNLLTGDWANAFAISKAAVDENGKAIESTTNWWGILKGILTTIAVVLVAVAIKLALIPALLWAIVPILGWLGATLSWIFTPLTALFPLLASGIAAVSAVIAPAIAAFMSFMTAVSSMMLPLLVLGITAIAVAAAFYIIGLAFKEIGSLGWAVIGPLAAAVVVFWGLTLVLPILSVALIGLAAAGWPGVVVLLAFGAAAIMVAGAVYIISLAFQVMSDAIIALSTIDALNLLFVSGSLIAFGVALGVAAWFIGWGGAALMGSSVTLLAAMVLLAAAMFVISAFISVIDTLGNGCLERFGNGLSLLAPGITAFLAAIGYGVMFSSAMYKLSEGANNIDVEKTDAAGESLIRFGEALETLSKFNVDNLSGIGSSLSSFTDSLAGVFDGLTAAVNRAIVSIVFGMSGIAFVVWSTQIQMTGAFMSLLSVIPTITDVTDKIAAAIESGQDKITSQMDALKISFAALELMSNKFGVSANVEESDKKKVMAETISTVQVKTETSGSATNRWKQEEMQQKQVDLMNSIATSVNKITGGSNMEDVATIKTLLQTYLPKMGESPSKLSTRLNNWS